MKPADWDRSKAPRDMLDAINVNFPRKPFANRPTRRQMWLFVCAVERSWWFGTHSDASTDCTARAMINTLERIADSTTVMTREAMQICSVTYNMPTDPLLAAIRCVGMHNRNNDQPLWAATLRDITGNPFEEPPSFDPKWRTLDVLALATSARTRRNPDGSLQEDTLSALSDALEESGCGGSVCQKCQGRGTITLEPQRGTYCQDACPACDNGLVPHPAVRHLRTPQQLKIERRPVRYSNVPRFWGMWSLDLCLGTPPGPSL